MVSASSLLYSVPKKALMSSISVVAWMRQRSEETAWILSALSSSSNSSSMSPTICSMMSSKVTRPDVPPYSSMTIAMWLRCSRNSFNREASDLPSGTKTAGRKTDFRWNCSGLNIYLSRSLACKMPKTSSLSSPMTGKREWAVSMM